MFAVHQVWKKIKNKIKIKNSFVTFNCLFTFISSYCHSPLVSASQEKNYQKDAKAKNR
jgi:hypothetical protein